MSHANEVYWSVLQTGEVVPLAIAGPGTGKTRSVEAFGRAAGRQVYTFIGSISEPTDLGGFPLPVADAGHMAMVPPKWAISMQGAPWILFLDELTCNAPAVQAAMLRVITDKRIGDFELPKDTWICSACNPPDQAANGTELEMPMANRLFHHKWISNEDAWDSGMMNGWETIVPAFTPLPPDWRNGLGRVGAKIAAFRRVKPSLWSKPPEDRSKRGGPWPSPRSWTMAGICLAAVEAVAPQVPYTDPQTKKVSMVWSDNSLRYQAVAGCVGDDAAHEFSKWEKTLDLPDPEKVLQDVIAASKAGRLLNGEVPILERADQTLAFLGALCDRVLHHDLCRERWEAGMEVIGSMWCSWKELCIIGAQPMSAAYQAGWKIPAEYASEAMPLMVRAGMFGGLKA